MYVTKMTSSVELHTCAAIFFLAVVVVVIDADCIAVQALFDQMHAWKGLNVTEKQKMKKKIAKLVGKGTP